MKKLMMLAMMLGVTCALKGALKDDIPDDYGLKEDLTGQTAPGTPLKNNTIYTVRGHALINAKANAGMSALRVPVGTQAVIEIPRDCSLTVIGGDAEGQIGAGAGIEVPAGAKLIICGEGQLTAVGGSAAPGGDGMRGANGELTPLIDMKTFPKNVLEGDINVGDVLGVMVGAGSLSKALDSILFVGKGGTGGAGGAGGGGAAAAIGGKGGRGGDGGAETVGRRVVPTSQWGKRKDQFETWFDALGWETPYVYGYSTWNVKSKQRTLNGATGSRGARGSNGMAVGEIIIAESVRVSAQPGFGANGGKSGTCGKPYSVYDMDHDNTQIMDFVVLGVQIGVDIAVTVASGGANKAAEAGSAAKDAAETAGKILKPDPPKENDDGSTEDDEEDEDTTQKLWFYGGGGGAGGAGGAAALNGIGPGGAGGGGGGSGGSGLFIVGSNLGDPENEALGLEANGHGGLGGEAYIPAGADESAVRARAFGKDASALNKGESLGIEGEMKDALDSCFNLYSNSEAKAFWQKSGRPEHANDYLRLGCWTTNYEHDHLIVPELKPDCFAYAGLPGLGGRAGQVSTDYVVYQSGTCTVEAGLDRKKRKDYSGKVICRLKLVIGNGQPDSEDWYLCGTVVAPCVVPAGSDGKIFAGYFDKKNGEGRPYFDKFGNPSTFPFIEGDTTLYAHWVDTDVDRGIRDCTYAMDWNFCRAGATLDTGRVYYFLEDIERNADEYGVSGPGVRIANKPGETVVFYIPAGVTVSFTGASGYGTKPGYAGIEVPEGVTLVVTGEGTLQATGGNAGGAQNGHLGGNGGYLPDPTDSVYGGDGRAGGNGSGGAAAAIGGSGGAGGTGGGNTIGNTVYCDGGKTKKNGNDGKSGTAGQSGGACGNVCIVGTVSVQLQGGEGAAGGEGGKLGEARDDKGSKNAQNYTGTGGGGGGGGGGSYSALTIGGGQGGGGGGGGGGSGSTMNNDAPDVDGGTGQGGFGASSAARGYSAKGKNDDMGFVGDPNGGNGADLERKAYHRDEVYGGAGGTAGAPGTTGALGTYSRGLNLDVTAPDFGDRESVVGDAEYVFGNPALQRTITFTYEGVTLGTVLAMMGDPLPTVIVDRLATVKGYDFCGAYRIDKDGDPVLDDFGFEDWWYDEFGCGEKSYDAPGDVTLEVMMTPKWYAMADWPDDPEFTYDGRAKDVRGLLDEGEGYSVLGGTLVATNAGVHFVQLKLKEGYEVWGDADWNDEPEVTNDVRTWYWTIQPGDVDVKLENQNYDWNSTNAAFRLSGTVPGDMVASFWISGMYAPGVFEITADILPKSEDFNHWPKAVTAVCTVPPAIEIESVLPFYPWDTGVALDIALVDEFADSVLTRYTNVTVRALTEIGECLDVNSTNVVTLDTFPVSELSLGYGTVIVDMKDVRPASRGKVWLWLAIDGMPASEAVEVDADTTATVDPVTGVLTYEIKDVNDIYPINYSWRFADEWNYTDPVQVSIDGGKFAPLGEQGYTSNEGATDFTPTENGLHAVGLVIGKPASDGKYKAEYAVNFKVDDPTLAGGGAPDGTVKVVRNLDSQGSSRYGEYTSLAAAVADCRYGDRLYIRGDVQGEDVDIPSGTLVILENAAAKIRPPRPSASRPWLAVNSLRDESGNIYGYAVSYSDAAARVSFGPDANGAFFGYDVVDDKTNVVFAVTNTYEGLCYVVDYKAQEADAWDDGTPTPGSNGVTYVAAPYLGANGLYRPRVTDDPTEYSKLTFSKNDDGTLTVTGVKASGIADGVLRIPSYYHGREVSAIGANAFKDKTEITAAELPIAIGAIPEGAFRDCKNLTEIAIPGGVTSIGKDAFAGCDKLERVTLPAGLTKIGEGAFWSCKALEEANLPASLKTIEKSAFYACSKLKAVAIPDNVFMIPESAFENCTSLTNVTFSPSSKLTSFGKRSFAGCEKLGEPTIPSSVNAFATEAFAGCKSLKFFEFPAVLGLMGADVFAGDDQLEAVYFDGNGPAMGGIRENMLPAGMTIYVRPGATGFGTVPGTYKGYTTVLWPDTLPVGYVLPGAIRADGNSYIRTGYLHKKGTRVECRVSVADSDAGGDNATIFGGGAGTGEPRMAFRAKYNGNAVAAYLEGNTNIVYGETKNILSLEPFPYAAAADLIRTVDLVCSKEAALWSGNGGLALIDASDISLGVAKGEQDIIVFAQNAGNGTPQSDTMSKCTLGWFKIYEEGDTPVRDFRPCKNLKTGELGLFDVANNGVADSERFKSAQGSGHITEVSGGMQEPEPEMGDEYTGSYTRMDEVRVNGTQWLDLGYTKPEGATVRLAGGIEDYTPGNLAVYGQGQGTVNNPSAIEDLFIYENGRLVRHYIPTERKANYEKGLYETFTSNFVVNVGKSESYILPRLPSAYQEVEYVENTLGQYVDTGYIPNDDSAFTIDFKYKGKSANTFAIFGEADDFSNTGDYSTMALGETDRKVVGEIGWLTYWPKENDAALYEVFVANSNYKISLSRSGMTVNGVAYEVKEGDQSDPGFTGSFHEGTGNVPENLYIFGSNYRGTLYDASQIQLRSFKITDNGGVQRDFVPCYRKDNPSKPLLLDLAHLGQDGCEYTPAGVGQFFTKGPNVNNR